MQLPLTHLLTVVHRHTAISPSTIQHCRRGSSILALYCILWKPSNLDKCAVTVFDIANSSADSLRLLLRLFLLLYSSFFVQDTSWDGSRARPLIASRTFRPLSHFFLFYQLFHPNEKTAFSKQFYAAISAKPLRSTDLTVFSLSTFLSKLVTRPCLRASSLSAMTVLLARAPSAAGYKVTSCDELRNQTRSFSAHREFKTNAGPSAFSTLSAQATGCQEC